MAQTEDVGDKFGANAQATILAQMRNESDESERAKRATTQRWPTRASGLQNGARPRSEAAMDSQNIITTAQARPGSVPEIDDEGDGDGDGDGDGELGPGGSPRPVG